MHRALSGLIVCAGFVAAASAQGPAVPASPTPPQPASTTQAAKVAVTVQGCVYDARLKYDSSLGINLPAATLGGGGEFVLEGSKELLRQIKAYHNGHEEQISGIVTIPPLDDHDTLTTTKRVGPKTTITAGGSQEQKRDPKKPDTEGTKRFLRLKVEEVRHVADRCPYPF